MRQIIIIAVALLSCSSCIKSPERRLLEKEKARLMVLEADRLFHANKYSEALDLYLKAADFGLKEPLLDYKVAFSYDKGPKKLELAEKYYHRALENLEVQNNIKYLAATYFNLAVIAAKKQDSVKKTEYIGQTYSLLSKLRVLKKLDGEDSFRLGWYYWDQKDFLQARKYFHLSLRDLRKSNPRHFYIAAAYYNIGLTYWQSDDNNTALWYWKKALALEPDNDIYKTWVDKARKIKATSLQ